ncbi:hypothetical protein ABW21_db0206727 [Orbilia brochopaga]|nr:hypothetical protein ABW21_db0206727 [Drechslerella brochopaga]
MLSPTAPGLRRPTTRQSSGPGQRNGLNSNAVSPDNNSPTNANQSGGLRRPITRQSSGPGQRNGLNSNAGSPNNRNPTDSNQTGGLRRPFTRQSSGPGQRNGLNSNAGSPNNRSPTTPQSQSGSNGSKGNTQYTSPRASANLTPSNRNPSGVRKGTTASSFRPKKPTGYPPIEVTGLGTGPLQVNTLRSPNANSNANTRPGTRAPNPSPNVSRFLSKDGRRKNGVPPPKFNSHREILNYAREKQGVGRLPELDVKSVKTTKSSTKKLGTTSSTGGQIGKGYPEIKVTTATSRVNPVNQL